nr:hypothetical protein [Tanacetum cinerariifolium]
MELPATNPDEGSQKSLLLPEGKKLVPSDLERITQLNDEEKNTTLIDLSGSQISTHQPFRPLVNFNNYWRTLRMISKVTYQPSTIKEEPHPTEHHSLSLKPSKPKSSKPLSESPKPTKKPESLKKTKRRHKKPNASHEHCVYESSLTSPLEKHKEGATSYVDLKGEMEGYHNQVYKAQENTYKSINHFMKILDKIKKEQKTYRQRSTNQITLDNMLREANNHGVMHLIEAIQSTVNSLKAHHDTLAITPSSKAIPNIKVSGSSVTTPRADKGKGNMIHLTGEEIQAYLDKKEQMEKATKNAELSKPETIKVIGEVVSDDGVKISGGKEFIKH